jgi:hypothetical protein
MSKLNELEDFFKNAEMPETPIQLDKCTRVLDAKNFIESHFIVLKAHSGNRTFLPYYNRLIKLKEIIENERK